MNRLFSKLHISGLIQSNSIYSRDFASVRSSTASTTLPKKTPHGYNLFMKSKIQKGVDVRTQFAEVAKQWKTISEAEKSKFQEEAAKLRKQAITEFTKLPKKEQQQQFDEVKKSRADLKNHRRLNAYRKFRKETNCPTRPATAFIIYHQEKYPHPTKEAIGSNAKKAAEEFKNLSDEEKKPYFDKYHQQLDSYRAEYEKWYKAHGEAYEKLKQEHAKPKKTAAKSTGRKKSMGLISRLKKRTTKRKTVKRKKATKVAASRRR